MSKHLFEDMVKAKRATRGGVKSTDSIRVKQKEPEFIPEEKKELESKKIREMLETIEATESTGDYKPNKSRYLLWVVAFPSVIFCFFAISLVFAKAKIIVNPKTQDVALSENLSASKDSNSTDGLSFDLVVIPGQESEKISTTGEKDVSIKATGTVLIFNAFSSSPQNLNVDTRLEGSNGKIYKTKTKTIVPGMGKDGTPGQVEVGIYADEAGIGYNSSSSVSFTIFGFKGTSKYSKFMAISKKGTTISGGFVGKAPNISDSDKTATESELKNTLQTDLLNKATVQIPDGFILFKNAVFLNTNDSDFSSTINADGSATLTLSGTLYGIILNEKELTKKIATDNIDKYDGDGSDIYISNIKDLSFSLPGQVGLSTADNTSLDAVENINFNLTGTAKIIWKLDVNKFTNDLLSKSKSDFTKILSQYPNIDSATMTISPVWKTSTPDQAKNINVIVNYPQ